jgi:hypothetical protein
VPPRPRTVLLALLLIASAGCTSGKAGEGSRAAEPPEPGACRALTPADVAESSNTSPVVDCADEHTAETFATGTFPARLTGRDAGDPALGAYLYPVCHKQFQRFLGGDESLVMRSTVSWAWFRPPDVAWKDGVNWWRCDVVGGGEQSRAFLPLPETTRGILLGKPDDRWLACVDGPTVSGSVKIPCSEDHTWRAVTTITLGQDSAPFPGDRVVEVRTRDFCSRSVAAWLNYPVDYDFGYTWFHEAEWKAGNRRSVCWAQTDQ